MFISGQSFPLSPERTLRTDRGLFFLFHFSAAFNEETRIHLVFFLYFFHSFVHILYFLILESFILFILTNAFSNIIMAVQITTTNVDHCKTCFQYPLSARHRFKTVYMICLHMQRIYVLFPLTFFI